MIKRRVDGLGGLKAILALHERVEKVGVLLQSLFLGEVMSAETGLRVSCEETALMAAGGKAMGAAGLRCDGCYDWLRHGAT